MKTRSPAMINVLRNDRIHKVWNFYNCCLSIRPTCKLPKYVQAAFLNFLDERYSKALTHGAHVQPEIVQLGIKITVQVLKTSQDSP